MLGDGDVQELLVLGNGDVQKLLGDAPGARGRWARRRALRVGNKRARRRIEGLVPWSRGCLVPWSRGCQVVISNLNF